MRQPTTDGGGQVVQLDVPDGLSVAFDVEGFDEAIENHGVRFLHFRGMKSPGGLRDRHDLRRGEDHLGSSNNMLYTFAGEFQGLLTGNSKALQRSEGGLLDAGQASMTAERFYRSTDPRDPVYLHPLDRLYLAEPKILVSHQQLAEASPAGVDRLKFPAVRVQDLADSRGVRYAQGVDFEVREGQLVFIGARRPSPGQVYSVRMLYRPFWLVARLMHEVRVAQAEADDGSREIVRMPQQAVVQREYLHVNEKGDDLAPGEPVRGLPSRQAAEPPDPADPSGPGAP